MYADTTGSVLFESWTGILKMRLHWLRAKGVLPKLIMSTLQTSRRRNGRIHSIYTSSGSACIDTWRTTKSLKFSAACCLSITEKNPGQDSKIWSSLQGFFWKLVRHKLILPIRPEDIDHDGIRSFPVSCISHKQRLILAGFKPCKQEYLCPQLSLRSY